MKDDRLEVEVAKEKIAQLTNELLGCLRTRNVIENNDEASVYIGKLFEALGYTFSDTGGDLDWMKEKLGKKEKFIIKLGSNKITLNDAELTILANIQILRKGEKWVDNGIELIDQQFISKMQQEVKRFNYYTEKKYVKSIPGIEDDFVVLGGVNNNNDSYNEENDSYNEEKGIKISTDYFEKMKNKLTEYPSRNHRDKIDKLIEFIGQAKNENRSLLDIVEEIRKVYQTILESLPKNIFGHKDHSTCNALKAIRNIFKDAVGGKGTHMLLISRSSDPLYTALKNNFEEFAVNKEITVANNK